MAMPAMFDEPFQSFWDGFRLDVQRARGDHHCPEPKADKVFHYTGMSLLAAIASSSLPNPWSKWWATSLAFMNDKTELKHGLERIQTELEAIAKVEADPDVKAGLDRMVASLKDSFLSVQSREVFCACFSAEGDMLSQWRGYGDGGQGVCLGFDLKLLSNYVSGVSFWVLYNTLAQVQVIQAVAQRVASLLRIEKTSGRYPANAAGLEKSVEALLIGIAASMKDPSFDEEKEFRIVYFKPIAPTNLPTKFRNRGGPALSPYVELEMYNGRTFPISHIRLGPKSSWDANIASVEAFFDSAPQNLKPGGKDMSVEKSAIPFT